MRRILLAFLAGLACAGTAAQGPGRWSKVVAEPRSPLSSGAMLAERLLPPTTAARLARFGAERGLRLGPAPRGPGGDAFDVYVPATMPAGGHGLVVFVPPGPAWTLPRGWAAALERRGLALVALRGAGNDAPVLERRIPLALDAVEAMRARLRLDPSRVYVAGFSGGARTAQKLAVFYPDVFHGALLLAGSDPFGVPILHGQPFAPPRTDLMDLLRGRSRIVLATGVNDLANRANDARTLDSLQAHCIAGARLRRIPRLGHWVPEGRAFEDALALLEAPVEATSGACWARLQGEVQAGLDEVAAHADAGRWREAAQALARLEDRYGGLAAPRSVELAARIAASGALSTR